MNDYNHGTIGSRPTFDQLGRSVDRFSLFNSKGKGSLLRLSSKIDLSKLLGDLDLETIDSTMLSH
jgi:hypothetical protein